MSCDYQSILASARCFECIPPGAQSGIQTKLMQEISGATSDVDSLMSAARCIATCIPPGILEEVKTNLLCEVVDNLEGELTIPTVPCDPDALAFIVAAGITDAVHKQAICQLVRDLKSLPAVGTKYWDRDILIYPFVGGNAAAHAVNLKTPGTYNLLFLGATPCTHSALGVQGQAATCWASTQYVVPAGMLNNLRVMWYKSIEFTNGNRCILGTLGSSGSYSLLSFTSVVNTFGSIGVNANTTTNVAGAHPFGSYFLQRREAANIQYALLGNNWTNIADNSVAVSDRYLYLFARDVNGPIPAGNADIPSDIGLSSFSLGTSLDPVGVTSVEKNQYKLIWDQFNSTLGRAHP